MKREDKKKRVTIKTLKQDIKQYKKLKKTGQDAKEWYAACAVNNLLENLKITLDYVSQMKKDEFDITVLFAMDLIGKFQSEELARTFIWKYFEFYENFEEEKGLYENAVLPIFQYIENHPNYNRLDFTKEMKEMMKAWKGKSLKEYIENDDSDYVTTVRFLIENQVFDIDNEYTAYWYSKDNITELTCLSCVKKEIDSFLETAIVDGKYKRNIVNERIRNVYIVKDVKKETDIDDGKVYEFAYETALIIETEKHCYVFWRDLIFSRIEVAICCNIEEALKTIKSVEKIQREEQVENPYTVTVERFVEEL